jgi:hypothetical protein
MWCNHFTMCLWSWKRIGVVWALAFDKILSRGSERRVMSDVRLAIVYVCGMPVRLVTMGGVSTSVPGQ